MRQYKHNCGATIFEYSDGSKDIIKYGKKFRSFKELKLFEKNLDPKVKDANQYNYIRDVYRDYRYK